MDDWLINWMINSLISNCSFITSSSGWFFDWSSSDSLAVYFGFFGMISANVVWKKWNVAIDAVFVFVLIVRSRCSLLVSSTTFCSSSLSSSSSSIWYLVSSLTRLPTCAVRSNRRKRFSRTPASYAVSRTSLQCCEFAEKCTYSLIRAWITERWMLTLLTYNRNNLNVKLSTIWLQLHFLVQSFIFISRFWCRNCTVCLLNEAKPIELTRSCHELSLLLI